MSENIRAREVPVNTSGVLFWYTDMQVAKNPYTMELRNEGSNTAYLMAGSDCPSDTSRAWPIKPGERLTLNFPQGEALSGSPQKDLILFTTTGTTTVVYLVSPVGTID